VIAFAFALLVNAATALAQVASDQPQTGAGAWFGALFWVGITLLLLLGAGLIAYQGAKRPNRR
jgi:LPXTG-motif cell wall-anchored protein